MLKNGLFVNKQAQNRPFIKGSMANLPEKPYFYSKKKMENKTPSENTNKIKSSETFEIPANGALGLLALGAAGIKAWRKKREEEKSKLKSKQENE